MTSNPNDIISLQELRDAKEDAKDLGETLNAKKVITPRYGQPFNSFPLELDNLAKAIQVALAAGAGAAGWIAELVVDGDKNQKQINDAQKIKNTYFLTLEDFGAYGDGTLHTVQDWIASGKFSGLTAIQIAYPHVTALTDSADWAALQSFVNSTHSEVTAINVYLLNKSVKINRALKINGKAYENNVNDAGSYYKLTGSTFLFVGAGVKEYTAYGVCSGEANGGQWANPDQRFILDTEFNQKGFYNDDGTPKLFSAAIYIGKGVSGVNLDNIQVIKNFNGVSGYVDKIKGWGDDWDVGVYYDNARYCNARNLNVLGYWGIAGRFIRSGGLSTETYLEGFSGAEENKFYNCTFQGHVSSLERSVSMFKILAVNAGGKTVTVPYFAGEPFTHAGRIATGEFTTTHTNVTSVTKDGGAGTIVIGVESTAGFTVGGLLSPSFYGNGIAGTVDQYCRYMGMYHTSGNICSSTWHDAPLPPSSCIELGGTRMRGRRYEGCKLQTIEQVHMHAHQITDLMLTPNMRYEASTDATGINNSRMVGTNMGYVNHVRELFRVQMHTEQGSTDFRPNAGVNPVIPNGTAGGAGMWTGTSIGSFVATQGIYLGVDTFGANDSRKLKTFYNGVFTPSISSSGSGFGITGQVRNAYAQIINSIIYLGVQIVAGGFSYTVDGDLQFNLPFAPSADRTVPVSLSDNGYPKIISLQMYAGNTVAKFFYHEDTSTYSVSGAVVTKAIKGALRPLKTSDLNVGGSLRIGFNANYPTDFV